MGNVKQNRSDLSLFSIQYCFAFFTTLNFGIISILRENDLYILCKSKRMKFTLISLYLQFYLKISMIFKRIILEYIFIIYMKKVKLCWIKVTKRTTNNLIKNVVLFHYEFTRTYFCNKFSRNALFKWITVKQIKVIIFIQILFCRFFFFFNFY